MSLVFPLHTPVELFDSEEDFDLFIKRDDKTFCGFGTKIRKFNGILDYLNENNIHDVMLYGNPHSNFTATFTILLHLNKKKVYAVHYTKDRHLQTVNSKLSKRFADSVYDSRTRENREFYLKEFRYHFPYGFIIPEYGIHSRSLEGLNSLWKEIDREGGFDYIFLDIGSGLTFVSACEYFKNRHTRIIGVSIGRPKDKMRDELITLASHLLLDVKIFNSVEILAPLTSPGYATTNSTLNRWIKEIWESKNIPLEPIYSGKTLFTIIHYLKKEKIKGRGIYIHQGGLLNHYRYYL